MAPSLFAMSEKISFLVFAFASFVSPAAQPHSLKAFSRMTLSSLKAMAMKPRSLSLVFLMTCRASTHAPKAVRPIIPSCPMFMTVIILFAAWTCSFILITQVFHAVKSSYLMKLVWEFSIEWTVAIAWLSLNAFIAFSTSPIFFPARESLESCAQLRNTVITSTSSLPPKVLITLAIRRSFSRLLSAACFASLMSMVHASQALCIKTSLLPLLMMFSSLRCSRNCRFSFAIASFQASIASILMLLSLWSDMKKAIFFAELFLSFLVAIRETHAAKTFHSISLLRRVS
mmetsp:Transcript_44299/g.117094  ORF Transcript_44299/g.117094 Transcript_44299/m.117094 type:complete len:287 (+) Transcript_44299:1547-2407(+)